jgi:hypothetical protein
MLQIKKNILVFIFLAIATTKSFALVGMPEVYVSGGISSSNSSYKTTVSGASVNLVGLASSVGLDSLLKTKTDKYGATALNLAVGVTPINLPIFNALRVELQYYNNFGRTAKISSMGGVAYLDLRILPFVAPYVGFGVHRATINLPASIDNNTKNLLLAVGTASGIKDTYTTALYSFHAGANVKIPLAGLAVFAEYKFHMASFDNTIKISKISVPLVGLNESLKFKTSAVNHGVVFGLKYFIL